MATRSRARSPGRAEAAVRQHTASWVAPVGKVGLAAQGVLYGVVAILALQVASGHGQEQPDQTGAIEAVAGQPFGRFLLFVLAVGLALHCVWRLMLAARGDVVGDDAATIAKRIGQLGRSVLYGGFTVVATRLLLNTRSSGGGSQESQKATATVLGWPTGPFLVAATGVVVAGVGVWHARKVFTRSFEDDLDLSDASEMTRKAVLAAGSAGYLARGVAFGLVGWFLVQASVTHDPNDAGGLDSALKRVADADYGPDRLRLLALGLLMFGVYRFLDARYRSREAIANA